MAFKFALSLPDGSIDAATETTITPAPAHPVYPPRFNYSIKQTDAGSAVRQRTRRQSGPYRWVWRNRSMNSATDDALYWTLFDLQSHIRTARGESPYVFLYENETRNFGAYSADTRKIEPAWIRCLVTFVGRTEQPGGFSMFDETALEFTISDPSIMEAV